jgi:carbonic anhydrase
MNDGARKILDELLEGNRRFREGNAAHYAYGTARIAELAAAPEPRAAILACSDSRITPELIFNQPLGNLFTSRVPGNVASDSAKWMLEIAVSNLKVPLVIVMGHTECLAVKQVVEGATTGSGGSLRYAVSTAVLRARSKRPNDLFYQSIVENALQSMEHLIAESWALKRAMETGQTSIATGIYDVHSGEFSLVQQS